MTWRYMRMLKNMQEVLEYGFEVLNGVYFAKMCL